MVRCAVQQKGPLNRTALNPGITRARQLEHGPGAATTTVLGPPAVQRHGSQAAFQDIIDAGLEKPLERVSPLSAYS